MSRNAYAEAGVDIKKLHTFKERMQEVAAHTRRFAQERGCRVLKVPHAHGGVFEIGGVILCATLEGLGNKNYVGEFRYRENPKGPTYQDVSAYDTAMMAVNDCIAQGARLMAYLDEAAASKDDWHADPRRAEDFARGLYEACEDARMSLVAGESPVYVYLINPRPPVEVAGVFSGCAIGTVRPGELVTGEHLQPGDRIIGLASSGFHSNGHSLLIKLALALPDRFETRLPSGMTFGDATLTRTRCYVRAVEAVLDAGILPHAILPGTGGGVAKLAWDKRPYEYYIHTWPRVHEGFRYVHEELGVPLPDCLNTFNWGVGYYFFVAQNDTGRALNVLHASGFPDALVVGEVREGKRGTIFGPANNLYLPPPEE